MITLDQVSIDGNTIFYLSKEIEIMLLEDYYHVYVVNGKNFETLEKALMYCIVGVK